MKDNSMAGVIYCEHEYTKLQLNDTTFKGCKLKTTEHESGYLYYKNIISNNSCRPHNCSFENCNFVHYAGSSYEKEEESVYLFG